MNVLIYDTKKCNKCKEIKPIEEMTKTRALCKSCKKAYKKEYISNNREKTNAYIKLYREKNKHKLKKTSPETKKAWNEKNKEKVILIKRAWKERNKEKVLAANREYNSRPEVKEKRNLRLQTDINYRLKTRLSSRVHNTIKTNSTKSIKTLDLLGCDVIFLKLHLENKFLPTMTWDNYGKLWHIDHILPCASFNLTDSEEQKKCFHYSNLQPLFAVTTVIDGIEYIGNTNKQDKIIWKYSSMI